MCTGDSASRLSVKRNESDFFERECVKVGEYVFVDGCRNKMWRFL